MSDDKQLLLPASTNASTLPPSYEAPGQAPSTATANMPYYQAPYPTTGYPGQPPVSNYQTFPPQLQQPQQVVFLDNRPVTVPIVIPGSPPVSFTLAIVLSCITFWFFGLLCGGIAFILAMIGQSTAAEGDIRSAIRFRNASYGLSIVGIFLGVTLIVIMVILLESSHSSY